MTTTTGRPAVTAAAAVLALGVLAGCGVTVPTDPDGTLDRVRGGELRVGVSPHEPWTVPVPDGTPTGLEVDLVEGFAQSLDADVVWTTGGEEELVGDLERGALDLVVGGFTASSPWTSKAAVTVSYVTVTDPDGKPEGHVMLTPMGENAFLVELERYLLDQEVQAP
ncbi:transporter substrate-binding domain-containing protein [Cellulomonas sp. Sa3CUA2]|uniref:Transporter substrate-binding domain-containing protein n=1 Tax=Cellulomonas avistercoris TaxID=2762242 RepID=A0ABR8QIP1_9CELL|nr:transporter substrate-binding domain-containing protein [Cellulomonas avistercoris]MBD7920264.1 transporter substrate-binding domain-containing protein [Cellulomonas avistercoris]